MDVILQRLSKLTDAELRTELKAAGQACGGIAKTTRKFFEKRLAKHLLAATETISSGPDTIEDTSKPEQKSDSSEMDTTDGAPKSLEKPDSSKLDRIDDAAAPSEKSNKTDANDGTGFQRVGDSVTTVVSKPEDANGKNHMKQSDVPKEKKLNGNISSDGLFYVVQIPTEDIATDVPDAPTFKG